MTKRKSIMLDDSCVDWYESQENAGMSIRLLITYAINKYGQGDLIKALMDNVEPISLNVTQSESKANAEEPIKTHEVVEKPINVATTQKTESVDSWRDIL